MDPTVALLQGSTDRGKWMLRFRAVLQIDATSAIWQLGNEPRVHNFNGLTNVPQSRVAATA